MCWNITRVSLWLLCNVHFLQSTQRARLQTRLFMRGINNILKLDVINAPMLTRVSQELECRIGVCCVTSGEHIEHL